jgi:hypothetical protein
MQQQQDDSGDGWEFFMGEEVLVGSVTGTVVGRTEHVAFQDHFIVSLIGDDGVQHEISRPQYAIAHTRKN